MEILYSFARNFFSFIFSVFFRWQISGAENIPKQGGVIIAANHISLWDPPVVGTAVPRPLHFMAKEELFANGILRFIITALNAFPVKRGTADRSAIRKALALLAQGELLGLFPEGTRSKNGELGNPEAGVAMIALKANVPIIPAAIIGTNKVFSKESFLPQFKIYFGKPVYPDAKAEYREDMSLLSAKIMQEIAKLQNEARHNR